MPRPLAVAAFNLAGKLRDSGRQPDAIGELLRAIALDPCFIEARHALAILLHKAGDFAAAVAAFRATLQHAPDYAPAWHGLGVALEAIDPPAAEPCYRRAAALAPGQLLPQINLAELLNNLGRHGEAIGVLDTAVSAASPIRRASEHAGLLLRRALLLPPILRERAEIDRLWANLGSQLDRLENANLCLDAPERDAPISPFYLTYHGLNTRALRSRIARTFGRACPALSWIAPHCRRARDPGRIRIGIISRHLHDHPSGKVACGFIESLDRSRFQAAAIFVQPFQDDVLSRRIRAVADCSISVPHDLAQAREKIAALELDVLFYQDIGMEPVTYFLAFARLARIQCTSFGHPDTTGIPNMDYFIGSELYEPPGGEAQYSEKLIRLPGAPVLADYRMPAPPELTAERPDLSVPARARMYLCVQSEFKIHPDFDLLAAAILRADPNGYVLVAEGFPTWARQLRERFARLAPDVADRLRFVPRQSYTGYQRLLAAVDVVLDTPHFAGMTTSLDTFAVGAPIVTLPGDHARGRTTQAMLRKMEIADCVAGSADEYVGIAVRLANEPDYRRDVTERIRTGRHLLFNDKAVIREFERFCQEAVGV